MPHAVCTNSPTERHFYVTRKENLVLVAIDGIESPVQNLPNELLYSIFHYAASDDTIPLSKSPVLAMAHVCQRWRNVALHLPTLWTSVTIDEMTTAESLYRAMEWANRRVLSVSIYLPNPLREKYGRLWRSLLLLASNLDRCKDLHINSHSRNFVTINKAFLSACPAPRLESLRVVRPDKGTPVSFTLMDIRPHRLAHLQLDGVIWSSGQQSYPCLRSIILRNTDTRCIGDVLQKARQIDHLSVAQTYISPWSFLAPVAHLHLEGCHSQSTLLAQLDHRAPIAKLTLANLSPFEWGDIVLSFQENPAHANLPKLKTLQLVDFDTSNSILCGKFAEATSQLEVLELVGKKTSVVPFLEILKEGPNVWSELKTIMVDGEPVWGVLG